MFPQIAGASQKEKEEVLRKTATGVTRRRRLRMLLRMDDASLFWGFCGRSLGLSRFFPAAVSTEEFPGDLPLPLHLVHTGSIHFSQVKNRAGRFVKRSSNSLYCGPTTSPQLPYIRQTFNLLTTIKLALTIIAITLPKVNQRVQIELLHTSAQWPKLRRLSQFLAQFPTRTLLPLQTKSRPFSTM